MKNFELLLIQLEKWTRDSKDLMGEVQFKSLCKLDKAVGSSHKFGVIMGALMKQEYYKPKLAEELAR